MIGFDIGALTRAIDGHGPVVRVVVADHKGSTPRETGTAMIVSLDQQIGTIGGGALELDAILVARSMLKSGTNHIVKHVPLGPALGQCCGGAVTLVLEQFTVQNLPQVEGIAFMRNLGGNDEPPLGMHRLMAAARRGEHIEPTFNNGWMIEPLSPEKTPVWIYGAGHVGQALVETLNGLPFDVTWVDTAENRFSDVPQGVTKLVASQPERVVKHAPLDAHHIVLTYSHALDLELCHAILSHDFASLGVIGSKTKRTRFQKRLSALGHNGARIAEMTCPIGDPSLGKLPKAIALGVVRELLTELTAGQSQRKHIL